MSSGFGDLERHWIKDYVVYGVMYAGYCIWALCLGGKMAEGILLALTFLSSVLFKKVSTRSGKPACTPANLAEVSPALKQFQ